jgi:hypothetical protein
MGGTIQAPRLKPARHPSIRSRSRLFRLAHIDGADINDVVPTTRSWNEAVWASFKGWDWSLDS